MCLFFITVFSSCTKLDTTIIGADLLPVVDNITTFADTLDINASQHDLPDSITKVVYNGNLALGKINNDPLFGTATGDIFLQLKPSFFPYYFGNPGDSIERIDSIVLCLAYTGVYGDTTKLQTLEVSPVTDATFRDSSVKLWDISYQPQTGSPIASKTFSIPSLKNYMFYYRNRDSVNNQIRIKIASSDLNPELLQAWKERDSSLTDFTKNSFRSDSLFKRWNNGFAIKAVGTNSNALMYVNATDAKTRLEVHYVKSRGAGTTKDTTYSSLYFISTGLSIAAPSAVANHVVRDDAGYPASNPTAEEFYVQTAPGNYVDISLPQLDTMSRRIIHRAYLEVTRIPDNPAFDTIFGIPYRLYLDAKDTGNANTWRPLPYVLTNQEYYDPFDPTYFFPTNGINYDLYGGYPRSKPSATGGVTNYYFFNVTRYIQKVVTDELPSHRLRLFAPANFKYAQFPNRIVPYPNPVGFGRVKIGSPDNPNPQYKMRFVVVYSRI